MTTPASPRHAGPPLLLVAAIYALLVFAGVFCGKLLSPGVPFVMPYDTVAAKMAIIESAALSTRWSSFFQLASAMPLLVFVATVSSRLRFLGIRAAGETIALAGGIAASILLVFSALADWAISTPEMSSLPAAVRALQLLGFMGGGPGFVIFLGLFYLGVSVTAGLYRLIPKWIMILGILIGLCCELASLTLVTWTAAYFIPVGRFLGLIWIIAVALTLPNQHTKHPPA